MAAEALLKLIDERKIPLQVRGNISDYPIPSITLGCVQKRKGGLGIANATMTHRGELLRLLLDVLNDEEISGDRPGTFTSICLNVNYAANLHVDKNNYDFSYIVGLGEYTGGQLFIADPEGNDTHAETDQNGKNYNIYKRVTKFSGKHSHGVQPYRRI